MRSPKIPEGAEVVRTFLQYEELVAAYFQGRYQLLIVIGRPGLMKSHAFETRLGPTSHLIKGWAAPLQAYMESYWHRNKLLIFDDSEVLWKRPGGRVLMRSLCEHKLQKLVQWISTTPALVKAGVPQSFLTSSKLALIANRFVFGDVEEYYAIVDRGHLVYFDPPPVEVHQQVAEWFWDQQIYNHVGERLHLLDNISARLYIKCWERKQAGGDWRKLIEEAYCRDSNFRIVQAFEVDPAFKTVEDRVRRFIEQTGACRATYFNIKRELTENDRLTAFKKLDVPVRELRGEPPAEPNLEEEVARAHKENQPESVSGTNIDVAACL